MGGKEWLLAVFTVLFLTSATLFILGDDIEQSNANDLLTSSGDPLFQYEGHDHKNASQHIAGTSNMELLDFNPLTTCLLYTSPSPRDQRGSRMPSSA